MGYRIKIYRLGDSIEYEISYVGNYGAKGEKRAPRRKATPEQIRRQNQINRENLMRRLIKLNFSPGDPWVALQYPEGSRPQMEQVEKDWRSFVTAVRKRYKKAGEQFKYVYRLEVGAHGGIHLHILFNRIRGEPDVMKMIKECWRPNRYDMTGIYEYGGYDKLAKYIVKQPDDEVYEQLSLFDEVEQKKMLRYSCSRNLERPVPEIKEYRRRTLRKVINNGPKATPGYYVDKSSIRYGVNPYSGKSYYKYTEYRTGYRDRAEGYINDTC
jgi:hypothetical protein